MRSIFLTRKLIKITRNIVTLKDRAIPTTGVPVATVIYSAIILSDKLVLLFDGLVRLVCRPTVFMVDIGICLEFGIHAIMSGKYMCICINVIGRALVFITFESRIPTVYYSSTEQLFCLVNFIIYIRRILQRRTRTQSPFLNPSQILHAMTQTPTLFIRRVSLPNGTRVLDIWCYNVRRVPQKYAANERADVSATAQIKTQLELKNGLRTRVQRRKIPHARNEKQGTIIFSFFVQQ